VRREAVPMRGVPQRWFASRRGRLAMAILFATMVILIMLAASLSKP
jgi:hypothetical protein